MHINLALFIHPSTKIYVKTHIKDITAKKPIYIYLSPLPLTFIPASAPLSVDRLDAATIKPFYGLQFTQSHNIWCKYTSMGQHECPAPLILFISNTEGGIER